MKLYSTIHVDVAAEEILARPGIMARLRSAFGGSPDLSTGRMRAALEAATIVDALRQGLAEIGATNAVSLVVGELVLFQDRDRRPDDLGDLFLAFHEYAPALDTDFRSLRLTVEHVETGVHFVIEIQARTEFPKGEPAVRVILSGRVSAFEPQPGEDAATYRARVEPLLRDPMLIELARVSFDSFAERARDAIARAMPEARCAIVPAEARPPSKEREQRPDDAGYDPHEAHYPNPMLPMFGIAMLGSAMMMSAPAAFAAPGGGAGGNSGGDDGDSSGDGDGDGGGFFDLDW